MENYLEEYHHHKNVFSQFRASKFPQEIPKAGKEELTFDRHQAWESDSAWNFYSAAAKCPNIDDDKTHIESGLAHRLVDESDLNFVKMHLLNHFSHYIGQLGNL